MSGVGEWGLVGRGEGFLFFEGGGRTGFFFFRFFGRKFVSVGFLSREVVG